MTLYQLVRRGQRIQELIQSFPDKNSRAKQPQYVIDRSFKRAEIEGCSRIQKTLFHEKVNQLIQKERDELKHSIKQGQLAILLRREKNARNNGQDKENSKAVNYLSTPHLRKEGIRHNCTKRIYLERKYHSKLAYQYQNIIQAKRIQDSKDKLKEEMQDIQDAPLVRNTIKVTRTERKTAGQLSNFSAKPFTRSHETERPDIIIDCSSSRKVLTNQKIREALDARERKYVQPVTLNSDNNLKKYSSSFHFSTLKVSTKVSPRRRQ